MDELFFSLFISISQFIRNVIYLCLKRVSFDQICIIHSIPRCFQSDFNFFLLSFNYLILTFFYSYRHWWYKSWRRQVNNEKRSEKIIPQAKRGEEKTHSIFVHLCVKYVMESRHFDFRFYLKYRIYFRLNLLITLSAYN